METAKNTDLPDLLEHLGYSVRRVGSRYHTTREMDSIRIKDRRTWKRYSNGKGGDAITFLQEFCGKDFREAVNYLLEFNGKRSRDSPARQSKPAQQEEKPAFTLPIPHPDQRRVFAYLQKRGIAPQVIRGFIKSGLLYEDSLHHNCVFVGRDSGGKPVFASKRGTYDLNGPGFKGDAVGSDKSVAFRLPCNPALDWVAVFEAPIDLMSFCTLHRAITSNAVALCGLYQGPLDTYLRENPHLKRIVLCLDADGPGQEATEKFQAEYTARGCEVSVRVPALGKDWNELLQHQVFGKEIAAPNPKHFQSKKEGIETMADLGKLISDKTAADTQWREQRQAEREAASNLRDESVAEIAADPEVFARYLDMQGDNPTYSAGNIAMVMKQDPEATIVFTRDRWKALGRFVLETEQLSLSDDPSLIPTGDFTRNGRHYYLLDMTRKDEVGVDIQTHTETVTQASDTNSLEAILQRLDAEMEVTTEDGYVGVLRLDHTSVQVTTDGYATKTSTLTASRSYPNLSEADVSLIPKSIEDKGKTLTLGDVKWSESMDMDGEGNPVTRYTATASYTGTASSRYATGYTVSASYTGEVSKPNCAVVTYTAIFGSEKAPEESKTPDGDEKHDPDPGQTENPSGTEAPDTVKEPVDLSGLKRPVIIGVVVLALGVGGVFAFKKFKERR